MPINNNSNPEYVGETKGGKKHGKGTYTWDNGDVYTGDYKDDNKHGLGTYTWRDGDVYTGDYKDDKMHGKGTITWTDGSKYVGEWKNDNRHGQGTLTCTDGSKHVGEWKDGDKHGQGTLTWANGDKYTGEWKDGKEHGQGTFTWASGEKYVGEWKDGNRHGQGTYTWDNGDVYTGDYKDGNRHGQGTLTLADGTKCVGKFRSGDFIDEQIEYSKSSIMETINTNNHCTAQEIKESHTPAKVLKRLAISIGLSYLIFQSVYIVIVFLVILLIHELGHFSMMKAFKWESARISFLGPFGAYAIGVPKKRNTIHEFIMLFMGPFPGIVLGTYLVFWNSAIFSIPPYLTQGFGSVMIYINLLNLLPAGFLDGGRILDILTTKKAEIKIILKIIFTLAFITYIISDSIGYIIEDGFRRSNIITLVFVLAFGGYIFSTIRNRKYEIYVSKRAYDLSLFLEQKHNEIPNQINEEEFDYIYNKLEEDGYEESEIYSMIPEIWKSTTSTLDNSKTTMLYIVYILSLSIGVYTYYYLDNGTYTRHYQNSQYTGEWKGGDMHGKGTLISSNGNKYAGEFKNGAMHGQGTRTWANGDKYTGEWKDGNRHGQGTYTWINGSKYVGEFKNGKAKGYGIKYDKEGYVTQSGIFKDVDNNITLDVKKPADEVLKYLNAKKTIGWY